jgi:hypothetical protein
MPSQRRNDAALDLMIRARGILNADEDAVVKASASTIAAILNAAARAPLS